VLTH